MTVWLGVDVGVRKGLDVALVDERRVRCLEGGVDAAHVRDLVARHRPAVIGIDSPRSFAAAGRSARPDELALRRAVCGIRWTPDEPAVRASPYYEWILSGLAVYASLVDCEATVIEVFPTASWTRWHGPRGRRSRSTWSRAALESLGLEGVPARTSQDARDAIAAAVTARAHDRGATEAFGEIVVPVAGPD